MSTGTSARTDVGALLREWRLRRRLSQLDLAVRADVSQRHVSFVETGRSMPSRALLLHLAEELDVPLREQNRLLTAAGFAPAFDESPLSATPLPQIASAVQHVLAGHQPFPALVVDRRWDLIDANDAVFALLDGVAPHLLDPPANVLRLSLHPDGLAPRIRNLSTWRAHLLHRLRRQVDATADAELAALVDELAAYPGGSPDDVVHDDGLVALLRLQVGGAELVFVSTVTTFGTPVDVSTDELSIEAFYPADARTASLLGVDRSTP